MNFLKVISIILVFSIVTTTTPWVYPEGFSRLSSQTLAPDSVFAHRGGGTMQVSGDNDPAIVLLRDLAALKGRMIDDHPYRYQRLKESTNTYLRNKTELSWWQSKKIIKVALIAFGLLVSVEFVYLGFHYIGDVSFFVYFVDSWQSFLGLTGAVLGLLWFFVVPWLEEKIDKGDRGAKLLSSRDRMEDYYRMMVNYAWGAVSRIEMSNEVAVKDFKQEFFNNPSVIRKRRLAEVMPTEDSIISLYCLAASIEEFGKEFPQLADWAREYATLIKERVAVLVSRHTGGSYGEIFSAIFQQLRQDKYFVFDQRFYIMKEAALCQYRYGDKRARKLDVLKTMLDLFIITRFTEIDKESNGLDSDATVLEERFMQSSPSEQETVVSGISSYMLAHDTNFSGLRLLMRLLQLDDVRLQNLAAKRLRQEAGMPGDLEDLVFVRESGIRSGLCESFEAKGSVNGEEYWIKVAKPGADDFVELEERILHEVHAEGEIAGVIPEPLFNGIVDKNSSIAGIDPALIGSRYVVCKKIAGEALWGRKYSVGDMLDVALQVADIVSDLHEKWIIHRDLRTDNVLKTGDGCLLIDFNLSWCKGWGDMPEKFRAVERRLSEEQITGKRDDIDEQEDIFSFGVLMLEMLRGERLVIESVAELEMCIAKVKDINVRKIIEKCVVVRAERYEDIKEVIADLMIAKRNTRMRWFGQGETFLRYAMMALTIIPLLMFWQLDLSWVFTAVLLGMHIVAYIVINNLCAKRLFLPNMELLEERFRDSFLAREVMQAKGLSVLGVNNTWNNALVDLSLEEYPFNIKVLSEDELDADYYNALEIEGLSSNKSIAVLNAAVEDQNMSLSFDLVLAACRDREGQPILLLDQIKTVKDYPPHLESEASFFKQQLYVWIQKYALKCGFAGVLDHTLPYKERTYLELADTRQLVSLDAFKGSWLRGWKHLPGLGPLLVWFFSPRTYVSPWGMVNGRLVMFSESEGPTDSVAVAESRDMHQAQLWIDGGNDNLYRETEWTEAELEEEIAGLSQEPQAADATAAGFCEVSYNQSGAFEFSEGLTDVIHDLLEETVVPVVGESSLDLDQETRHVLAIITKLFERRIMKLADHERALLRDKGKIKMVFVNQSQAAAGDGRENGVGYVNISLLRKTLSDLAVRLVLPAKDKANILVRMTGAYFGVWLSHEILGHEAGRHDHGQLTVEDVGFFAAELKDYLDDISNFRDLIRSFQGRVEEDSCFIFALRKERAWRKCLIVIRQAERLEGALQKFIAHYDRFTDVNWVVDIDMAVEVDEFMDNLLGSKRQSSVFLYEVEELDWVIEHMLYYKEFADPKKDLLLKAIDDTLIPAIDEFKTAFTKGSGEEFEEFLMAKTLRLVPYWKYVCIKRGVDVVPRTLKDNLFTILGALSHIHPDIVEDVAALEDEVGLHRPDYYSQPDDPAGPTEGGQVIRGLFGGQELPMQSL